MNSYKKIKVKVEVKQLSAEAKVKVKVEQLSAEVKAKNSEKRILNPPSRIRISYLIFHISHFLSRISCFISRISNVSHISTCAEPVTFHVSATSVRISYFVFHISYFVFRISYFVFCILYFVFRISYFVFRILYFVFFTPSHFLIPCSLFLLSLHQITRHVQLDLDFYCATQPHRPFCLRPSDYISLLNKKAAPACPMLLTFATQTTKK